MPPPSEYVGATMPLPPAKNFRAIYCENHSLPPEDFERTVFHHSLYWHARPLRFLLGETFFIADREFIRSVAAISGRRHFGAEAADFHHHPGNRSFWRRVLLLRVSAHKLSQLVEHEFAQSRTRPLH